MIDKNTIRKVTTAVATGLHDIWRNPRKIAGTETYEPRPKKLGWKDILWILKNRSFVCDIANHKFESLPWSWQVENWHSANVAVKIILYYLNLGMNINDIPTEIASAIIHQQWVKRNWKHASPLQLLTYYDEKFPEYERERDRVIWREAVKVWKEMEV